MTCQLSWISTSDVRIVALIWGGYPGSSVITRAPADIHSECLIPLAKDHRPVSRKPPSTGTAFPNGAKTPAVLGGRPPAKISSMASSGRNAPTPPKLAAPIIRHQPADGSISLTASSTSNCVTRSASAPPSTWGSFILRRPNSYSASTEALGSVAVSSPSSVPASSVSRTLSTASIRTRRFSPRSTGNIAIVFTSL